MKTDSGIYITVITATILEAAMLVTLIEMIYKVRR
jgi:hypothetical protein